MELSLKFCASLPIEVSGSGNFLKKDTNSFSCKTTSYVARFNDYSEIIDRKKVKTIKD